MLYQLPNINYDIHPLLSGPCQYEYILQKCCVMTDTF